MRHIQRIRKRKGVSTREQKSPLQVVQDCIEVRNLCIKNVINTALYNLLERIAGSRMLTRVPQYVVSSNTQVPSLSTKVAD